jgi:hypothetical protein
VEGGAVQAQVAGDAGGGPALGGQADRLGPALDLEGDHLWGQVDAKGGRRVDGLMHGHLVWGIASHTSYFPFRSPRPKGKARDRFTS